MSDFSITYSVGPHPHALGSAPLARLLLTYTAGPDNMSPKGVDSGIIR